MKVRISLFLVSALLSLANCGHPKDEPLVFDCSNEQITWTNYAGPVLKGTCGIEGCHDKNIHQNDFDYSDYLVAKNTILADPKRFVGALQHTEGYKYMPLNDYRMPEDVVKKISCWIQSGMPE